MLLRREAVRALAGVEGRLLHPVPDRLGRGLKLAPALLGRSAMPDQLDHLPPERRRVRPMALRHRGRSLPPQPWGVHETGSTPNGCHPIAFNTRDKQDDKNPLQSSTEDRAASGGLRDASSAPYDQYRSLAAITQDTPTTRCVKCKELKW